MKDSVLITGGLGYLGGRIAKYLIEQSGLSILLGTRKRNFSHPEWLTEGRLLPFDLLTENDLAAACRGVRYVVHLAALNHVDSEVDPEQALLLNSLGTLKLLRASEHEGVERFIYISTAHVYGSPLVGTITEQTSISRDRSLSYKKFGEGERLFAQIPTELAGHDFFFGGHLQKLFHPIWRSYERLPRH